MAIIQPQLLPWDTFGRQSLTLLGAEEYLLQAEFVARRLENADLTKTYRDFHLKVRDTYINPTEYFVAILFVNLISCFELFLQDTAIAVVLKNPKKVGGTTFSLSEILDAPTPDYLVRRAIDQWLNKVMYEKPAEYLKQLTATLAIDETPFGKSWALFIEAKARRDIGLHNDWKCNSIYLKKVKEAGVAPTADAGDRMIPDTKYLKFVSSALVDLAGEITSAVIGKHWPETNIEELTFKFKVDDV